MPDKRFQPKPALSKQEESNLNKKITLGAALTMIFLLLFMFTQFAEEKEITKIEQKERPFDELSPEEKLDRVQSSEQNLKNDVNYQRAITLQNRLYCDLISDEGTKAKCISETPEISEEQLQAPPQKSTEQIMDETNYQRAITLRNRAYCDVILSQDIKDRCLEDIAELE